MFNRTKMSFHLWLTCVCVCECLICNRCAPFCWLDCSPVGSTSEAKCRKGATSQHALFVLTSNCRHKGATLGSHPWEAPFQLLTRDIGPGIHKVWAVLFPFQLGLPASRSFSCDLRHCKSSKNCGRPDRLQRFFFALHGSRFFSLLRCRARSFAAPAMQQQLLAQCICAQLLPATLVESWEIIMGKMRSTVTVQASIIGPKIWESSSACSFGRCSSSLQQFTGRRLEEPMSLDRRLSSKEQRAKSCIETWLMTQRWRQKSIGHLHSPHHSNYSWNLLKPFIAEWTFSWNARYKSRTSPWRNGRFSMGGMPRSVHSAFVP